MAVFHLRWLHRPQHPALRLLLGALAIVFVAGIVVLGFFALLAFAFIGVIVALVRALTRPHRVSTASTKPSSDPHVIEGEYVIVHNDPALKH